MPTFVQILNLSFSGSILAIVLMLAERANVLGSVSKRWHCALWALVAVRLLVPVSIESPVSMLPTAGIIPESYLTMEPVAQNTPVQLEIVTNPMYDGELVVDLGATADRVQVWDITATVVWLAGLGAMMLYALFSYLSLRFHLRMAAWVRDNIYECDGLESPFILGILRPRIYLPSDLDSETRAMVLAHENAHLKRLDHIFKPLGFFVLSVHWFNPVIWLGYRSFCRDIELACDERVIRTMDKAGIRAYSEALVRCSVPRRSPALCPLAFGEGDVKGRIKRMLDRPRLTKGMLVLAVIATVLLTVCFLTNPIQAENQLDWIIKGQNGCQTLGCMGQDLTLELRKDALPENVLNGQTHSFAEAPVLLEEFDNTRLAITEARISGDELLVTITLDHDLPDTGSILLPIHPFLDSPYTHVQPAHADTVDAAQVYPDSFRVREVGRDSFSVAISMDVWSRAQEYLRFQVTGLYNLRYSFEPQPVVDTLRIYSLEANYLLGPSFRLRSDGTFTFHENPLSSYLGVGSYTITENRLVMQTDDGSHTWTFREHGGAYIFDAENSSPVMWYPDLKNYQPLPDGARFVMTQQMPGDDIEDLLNAIISSPAHSSNPGDYINAHRTEFDRLLEKGQNTVMHCFRQFAAGHQTDLKGHIMAQACRDIIGPLEDIHADGMYMTGQDWFDAFASHALALREEYGSERFAQYYPYHDLALQYLGI